MDSARKKYTKDMLSDKDLERLTITIRGEDGEEERIMELEKEEERRIHKKYKGHRFRTNWEPLSPEAPLNEEWFIANPDVLSEDDPGYLCEMCRHLDFDVLFKQRGLPSNNDPSLPTQIELDGVAKVMDFENSCAFCTLLRQKIVHDGMLSPGTADDSKDSRFSINVIDEGPDYALRLEIQLGSQSGTARRFVVHRVKEEPKTPLGGRLVQQERADMNRLREWLQICEGTHRSPDESHELGLTSLRVIDTEELRVREVKMPFRYACLSYVWGKGSETQYKTTTRDDLELPDALHESKADLPQTIKDAIKVTKECGLRYLWVDAFCILQDDPEDKKKLISKMGFIYGGGALTIVASTNANPHEGLPGMGTVQRPISQSIAKVQGLALAVALHDPRQPIPDIESSVWNSRAWTFQERALSRRSVYFTGSQMAFKCVHGAVMLEENVPIVDASFRYSAIEDQEMSDLMALVLCHQSMCRWPNKGLAIRGADSVTMMSEKIDLDKLEPEERRARAPVFNIKIDAPRNFMDSLGNTEGSTPWDMYRRAVDDYTKRYLSWESDVVAAFTGVEHILRRGFNTKFWFGLPEFAIEEALMWHAEGPLERRSAEGHALFPSWSWAAWKGHVKYRGRGWKNSASWNPVPVIRWLIKREPQWLIDRVMKREDLTDSEKETLVQQAVEVEIIHGELPFASTRHLHNMDADDWVIEHDELRNLHIYTHSAYQGIRFNYPVNLPEQDIHDRPDENGVIVFLAHVVPVISCDMEDTPSKMRLEDRFLQIGTNDESRSSNYRPPWQRIVYHQGYRAGFLTLNTDNLPNEDDGCEYHLAAILRGSLPWTPPPPGGWDNYWSLDPRTIQTYLSNEEWRPGESVSKVPNEIVEPDSGRQIEDGDPHWDGRRFGVGSFDVYEVLFLRTRNGVSQRMGGGKVNVCAFAAAGPEPMKVQLA